MKYLSICFKKYHKLYDFDTYIINEAGIIHILNTYITFDYVF